jgi:drug/metabolite transporter (DMT)-like permease
MVRALSGEIPIIELVFFRNVVALVILAPWMMRRGIVRLPMTHLALYGLRVMFAYTAMVMLFYALARMPIADVYALQYTIPLFTILAAVLVLKQHTGAHSWAACLVGFAGALIIMRPGIIELTLAAVCAISSALMSAGSNTTIKLLSRTESPETITVWTNLLMMPLALVPMLYLWVTPSWGQAPWVLGVGVASSLGGYCFTRAVASADARIVQPFQFSRMIFATAIGFVMFAELPDVWTWIGAVVIFVASYYVVLRERKGKPALAGRNPPREG